MDDALLRLIVTFPIFIFSLTIHEAAHAITAQWGGDKTSAYLGRVSLNPIVHMDPLGTVIVPFFGALSGIPLIGWAKPVPVVEENFRRGDSYGVIVALAGPFSNLLIALFTVVFYMAWLAVYHSLPGDTHLALAAVDGIVGQLAFFMILINIALMTFNLIPLPPLDGSHVLWHWFIKRRPQLHQAFFTVRQFSMFLLLALLWTGAIGIVFRVVAFPLLQFFLAMAAFPVNTFVIG